MYEGFITDFDAPTPEELPLEILSSFDTKIQQYTQMNSFANLPDCKLNLVLIDAHPFCRRPLVPFNNGAATVQT